QGRNHPAEALGRHDRLDAQLVHAFLVADLTDRRIGALAREERPGSGGVPRAALVPADPAAARDEDRVARLVERLARDEPDELVRRHRCTTDLAAASISASVASSSSMLSGSITRHRIEYCGWLETNFSPPGIASAASICFADHSLNPRERAFPCRTTSVSASIVSSSGVCGS